MRFYTLPLLFVLPSVVMGFSQETSPAGLPKDPVALLSLGLEENGLHSSTVRPWHIRGHYTLYDEKGKPEDQGVYEEWWVSPTRYKRSFNSPKFTQTDYANGTGLFREGAKEWFIPGVVLRRSLIEPVPTLNSVDFTAKEHTESAGKIKLTCVSLTYRIPSSTTVMNDYFPTYCFNAAEPALRLSSTGSPFETLYNQITLFQGHYLAHELHISMAGKPSMDLSLDVVEEMAQIADSFPEVPSSALTVDLHAIVFSSESGRHGSAVPLLKKAAPVYPISAKEQGIQGTVVINVTIETNGHVGEMKVVSGPVELRDAALDAVRQWIYRPFSVLGVPYAVETEIRVIFTLG